MKQLSAGTSVGSYEVVNLESPERGNVSGNSGNSSSVVATKYGDVELVMSA